MGEDQTRLLRRITAEHAWRTIFAHEQDSEVASLRPRVVDPEAVKFERQQWENWHEQQVAAEKDIASEPST